MNSTMLGLLRDRAGELQAHGLQLIERYSETHPANKPNDSLVLISPTGNYFWNELPPMGKVLQAKLLPEIDRFMALVLTLTITLPKSAQDAIKQHLTIIRGAAEQDHTTWWQSKEEALEKLNETYQNIFNILENYFKEDSDHVLVIPDTNALLRNPQLEQWRFDNVRRFTFVFAPTILKELDSHKINHRNPDVRAKAETLIRQLKEYRRRGSMHRGVPIVTGLIDLRWIAHEPDMSKTLSWFENSNADDRFLATVVEFIRNNLSSVTFIVTDDVNMLNKADYASIPSRDVPTVKSMSD